MSENITENNTLLVEIGGHNVPFHLQDLVLQENIHPDKVNAVADLFISSDDFLSSLSSSDERLEEVIRRWDLLDHIQFEESFLSTSSN